MADASGEPYFDQRKGSDVNGSARLFSPRPHARGPWSPTSLHGRLLAGLMAREIERAYGDNTFQFTRLTVDLFRQPPLAPVAVSTELVRNGNRIRVADSTINCEGVEIARASAVLLRRAEQPSGRVWSPPAWDMPSPETFAAQPGSPWRGSSLHSDGDTEPQQKRVWTREERPLVAGEELTPLVRVALVADYTNPVANSGSGGLAFINADITMYLYRLPVNDWLGLEVAAHHSTEGVAVAACTLYDVEGAIGHSLVCAVADRRTPTGRTRD